MHKSLTVLTVAVASMLASAGGASAQDVRWSPWLGCWTPADRQARDQNVQVCVVPAPSGGGVRMVTFAGDQIMLDETITADAVAQVLTEDDCAYSRTTRWAARGPRLYTTTQRQCASQPVQQSSSLSVLTGLNEWLDVQVTTSSGRDTVRTRRYTRSTAPPAAVADVVNALPAPALAEVRPGPDDVIEASQAVSPRAVEAWLIESGPQMAIDRRALRKLADAHVTEPVIDLLVALAYPSRFDVQRPPVSGGGGMIGMIGDGMLSPWETWAGPWTLDPYSFFYAPFLPWGGFDMYSYYMPYGNDYVIVGGGGVPTVSEHGQVVNGQGYTRVQPHPEPYVGGPAPGGGASFSGGDSGGSASPGGYSSGGGGATGLTAVSR